MTRCPFTTLRITLLLASVILGGCGSYTVRGRVIEASMSTLTFVDADDTRLAQRGVSGAEVTVYRDPDKPNRARVGRGVSGPDGTFSIPLNAFGAGFLVEEFEISAQRGGYQPVQISTSLPDGKLRLLIMLSSGRSAPLAEPEDLMDTYEKYR